MAEEVPVAGEGVDIEESSPKAKQVKRIRSDIYTKDFDGLRGTSLFGLFYSTRSRIVS